MIHLRANTGTRAFIVSPCTNDSNRGYTRTLPDKSWVLTSRAELDGKWWHTVVIETNTGTAQRGIRWPVEQGKSDQDINPSYRSSQPNVPQENPDKVSWACEICKQKLDVEVKWETHRDKSVVYDLVVDLGTSRSSALFVKQGEAGANISKQVAPLPFWPEGISGDTLDNKISAPRGRDYSVVPSLAFLYPHTYDAPEIWEPLLYNARVRFKNSTQNSRWLDPIYTWLHFRSGKQDDYQAITQRPLMFIRACPLLLSAHSSTRESSSLWNRLINVYNIGASTTASYLQPAPKRYLASENPILWGFPMGLQSDKVHNPLIARIMHTNGYDWQLGLIHELYYPTGAHGGVWRFPRHGSLVWYCLGILEQAWEQLQSDWLVRHFEGPKVNAARIYRRFGTIIATMPPGWPPRAKIRWRAAWQRAIDLFRQLHIETNKLNTNQSDGVWPVLGEDEIDEASAAQIPFVGALLEGGGESLSKLCTALRRNGNPSKNRFRVMTIDVGGGTTDLSICRYEVLDNYNIQASIVMSHSSVTAGDEVVYELLEKLIIPKRLENIPDSELRDQVRLLLNQPDEQLDEPWKIQMHKDQCYLVFTALAHELLKQMAASSKAERESGIVVIDAKNTDAGMGLEYIQSLLDAASSDPSKLGNDEITLDRGAVVKIFLSVMRPVLQVAACQILAHKVDLVLLSGKLVEINELSDAIVQQLPVLPSRVMRPREAPVSSMFPPAWLKDGRVKDSKCLVPVGAAMIHALRHTFFPGTRLKLHLSLKNHTPYEWGFITPGCKFIKIFDAHIGQGRIRERIFVDRQSSPKLLWDTGEWPLDEKGTAQIARRMPDHGEAEFVYSLKVELTCRYIDFELVRDTIGEDLIIKENEEKSASLTLDMIGDMEHPHERMRFATLSKDAAPV